MLSLIGNLKYKAAAIALGGLLLILGCSAAPRSQPLPWRSQFTIAPGDFAEANLQLRASAAVTASFSVEGGQLQWNVHTHPPDAGFVNLVQGQSAAGTIPLTA